MKKIEILIIVLFLVFSSFYLGFSQSESESEAIEVHGTIDTDGTTFWLETEHHKSYDILFTGDFQQEMLKKMVFSKMNKEEGITLKGMETYKEGRLSLDISSFYENSEKYADAKKVLTQFADLTEDYVKNLNSAEDAESVAKALDDYTTPMKDVVPELVKILKKYPELKDETTHPEELKPLMKRFNKVFQNLMAASAKVMKYANNPAVQEANKRYKDTMSALR
jgi:hypothetical protein